MKKIIVLIAAGMLLLSSRPAFAYWAWSSETGKWINPSYQLFDTPEEQFAWAKGYYDEGDYGKAYSEFRKLIRKFPKNELAPEAKFYTGLCLEKMGKPYNAYQAYQFVIDFYPLNQRLEEIVEKEYLIAEKFFQKRQYELAKEIFEKILVNAPYGKVADIAQYKSGLCDLKMRDYISARDAFDKIPENYSFSTYLDDAVFYAGFCSFKLSSTVKNYDEGLVDKAVQDLEYFLRRYETSEYVPQAESLLNKLRYVKAEKLFRIARFYEKQHKTSAALKYYQDLVYNYGKTSWAEKAQVAMKTLREK